MIFRDCYGYRADSEFYKKSRKQAYEIEEVGGVTFIRFSSDDIGPIHKIFDNTKIAWAYGSWAARATLTYNHDLNTSIQTVE